MKKHVLVIGSTKDAFREIRKHLGDSTTEVIYSASCDDARNQVAGYKISLVMMELDYVNRDSRELLKSLHEQVPVPILILYGNTGDIDKREDIRAGPEAATNGVFDMESCIVRAKSFMDIYACLTDNDDRAYILACGQDLVINPAERTVSLRGEHLDLSHKQFDLLFCLASHPGQVLSKEQLFNYLWGEPDVEVDNSIVLYISKLRKKLNKTPGCPEFIQTVRGVGYKFSKI